MACWFSCIYRLMLTNTVNNNADELCLDELCRALGHSQVDSWAIKEHPFNAEMSSRVWFFLT